MPSALEVKGLHVYYGQSHALQGVDLELGSGVLSVVGRNGMGKTTLCKTIMGLEPAVSGGISLYGESLTGKSPAEIARLGIGYVPQGRRLWKSLTVDEHFRLVAKANGPWSIERVYSVFPRLAERKNNGGGQLSGGEQQMLAIGRALLLNPKLLLMDEPTEGLAPVIVNQVAEMLTQLGRDGDIDVLMIEQNIGVACAVADRVAIMINGRINRIIDSSVLASDKELQQALLGVGRHAHDETPSSASERGDANRQRSAETSVTRIYLSNPVLPDRWTPMVPAAVIARSARVVTGGAARVTERNTRDADEGRNGIVYVCGTLDTKGVELRFMRDIIRSRGVRVQLVDLSTTGKPSGAEIPPNAVATFHPRGATAVFTGDRGSAVAGMTTAFEQWINSRNDVAGVIAAGGSGGTALVSPGFRRLAVGVPKLIVSTVASGNTAQYVGSSDITMMHSVADVQGINKITRVVLQNAAEAVAAMAASRFQSNTESVDKPALGITMFGVTTACVSMVSEQLSDNYDCLVFHATGTGGRSMEKLVSAGQISAVLDLTTTELADKVGGGVFAADDTRMDVFADSGKPYIGACGALDMVNFNAPDTVPERYKGRTFYEHNPQITLMRTTVDECRQIGKIIGEKLNRINKPVRFFLNEGGVSALDAVGQPFWDPVADAALFDAIEQTVVQSSQRQLIRVTNNINDPEFADLVVKTFRSLNSFSAESTRRA